MIHFVVQDKYDSVGVVVLERVISGQRLIRDKETKVHAQSDIPIGHRFVLTRLYASP